MDSLVEVVNKLQMVQSTIGQSKIKLNLPQIVVIGSQSAGKSSVLEAIVGRSFLPRGDGMVTRCPLVLQLLHTVNKQGPNGCKTWAEFHHSKEVFTDFEKVRQEIADETERITEGRLSVTDQEIVLRISSPDVPTLTLVDLPGFTTVPLPNQPADLPDQIDTLVDKYICNPNMFIIAVMEANTDLTTSESFNAAKQVDPSGDRTLAVITKLDIMHPGTDANDILTGKVLPFKLGIVGVVNQSQKDIKGKVSLNDTRNRESKFFATRYPRLASQNGTTYLTNHLSKLLVRHIKTCLPDLQENIINLISDTEKRLHQLAQSVPVDLEKKAKILLNIIEKFVCTYQNYFEVSHLNLDRSEVSGGARIFTIFNEDFHEVISAINALDGISEHDITTTLKMSRVPSQTVSMFDKSLQILIKKQIPLLMKPALMCIELVCSEMEDSGHKCLATVSSDTYCFPNVPSMILETLNRLIKDAQKRTWDSVRVLIESQLSYINLWHPDFIKLAKKKIQIPEQPSNKKMPKVKDLNGIIYYFMSQKDANSCQLVQSLIESYMAVIVREMEDLIPKYIISMQVESVLENLFSELILQMYTSDHGDKALQISEYHSKIKKQTEEALEAYKNAQDVLMGVFDF